MSLFAVILAGLGGCLAIGLAAWAGRSADLTLLMAPFGASCVLLFTLPQSPLSQPVNVIGGHVLSAAVGLAALQWLPEVWWTGAVAVGAAIALMALLRVTHPPAGANPLVILAAHAKPGFLLFPVFSGAVLLVLVAVAFHRLTRTGYPQ